MKNPTALTLEEWVRDNADFAAKVFKDRGELTPMWIAQTKTGEILPICAPMTDKDVLVKAIKKLFKDRDVVRYVFMVEAWTLAAHDGDKDRKMRDYAARHSLADHPGRRECIMVSGEDAHNQIVGMMFILRPEHGKPTVSPFNMTITTKQGGHVEGRMAGLLP